jgi:hypothetical protein
MQVVANETANRWTKLLIVCLQSDKARIGSIVSRFAPLEWEVRGDIRILPYPDLFRQRKDAIIRVIPSSQAHEILARIDRIAPPQDAARLVLVGSIPLDGLPTSSDLRVVTRVNSAAMLEKALPAILKQIGCDWESDSHDKLAHFHTKIGSADVERWLSQFAKLKSGWMGVALLQMLDVWPVHRLCEALFEVPTGKQSDWVNTYDLIVYNDTRRGESAAMISRLVKVRWGSNAAGRIRSVPELLASGDRGRRILYLEDCIMTGEECLSLLKGPFAQIAAVNTIDLKFAVGTAYGVHRLQNFIREGFKGISIIQPVAGYILNLTPDAIAMSAAGALFDESGRMKTGGKLLTGIQLRGARIFNSSDRKLLHWFCRTVGRQLMFEHFQDEGFSAAEAVDMADANSFGFGGLGLLLAFAHGVPDNTLPLFRSAGRVSVNGCSINWLPLFPLPQKLGGGSVSI